MRKPVAIACGALLLGAAWVAQAQSALSDVRAGERLSDWLLRNQSDDAYPIGLTWLVPEERPAQQRLKNELLGVLAQRKATTSQQRSDTGLAQWIRSLHVTGRVTLSIPDARWMQGAHHRAQDPILRAGQQVVLPRRLTAIIVVAEDGRPCSVPHVAGASVAYYVSSCHGEAGRSRDWAWLAQPDGRQSRYGVSAWNEAVQDEPAPGAWIWSPSRDSGLVSSFSDGMIRFLASQGPYGALGPGPAGAASPSAVTAGLLLPATPVTLARTLRDPTLTANDWGEIGLLQTPTARMAAAGEMRFQFSIVPPYTRGTIMTQPFDWLEAGFRYTDVGNRAYGPPELSGSQSYKDKSFDLKLRLFEESHQLPQIALGVRDIGGTGLFSSEYLVASKRTGDFDWSLGLGWGNLGARGNLGNPLSILGKRFEQRAGSTVATGGTVNIANMFHGPTALFGGVQWQTPWNPLTFKLEYEGNDYQKEPLANSQTQKSPFNLGLVYRYSPSIDISAGLERGNRLMLGVTLHSALDKVGFQKIGNPLPPYFRVPGADGNWQRTANDIRSLTGWSVASFEQRGAALWVTVSSADGAYRQERFDRMVHVLDRDAAADIKRFAVRFDERGLGGLHAVEVDRAEWLARRSVGQIPSLARADEIGFSPARSIDSDLSNDSARRLWSASPGAWTFGVEPSFTPIFGGPDAFLLYQLGLRADASYRINDSTWVSGSAHLGLLDNYDQFKFTGPSNLPRVRTFQREFVTSSRLTLPNLQVTHVGQLSDDQSYSVYGGLLESMYAGVGAEWLYRPWRSPVALGIDVNHVRQRDFRQDLALRDYRVSTGHATLYWDTGWNGVQAKVAVGQYLAGDRGVTLDLSRRFDNGVTLGAYATKTNVSKEQFGEGSFDKGVYISMPFDAMLPLFSPIAAKFVWSPLTRDGGARLNRKYPLYDLTDLRHPRSFNISPPSDGKPRTGDDIFGLPPQWAEQQRDYSVLRDLKQSTAELGSQLVDPSAQASWLGAAGAILLASTLDKPIDRWAQNLQGNTSGMAAKVSNKLPLLLGAGAGALALGLGGDSMSGTGWTALKAAGFTLLANQVVRFGLGRSRPEEGLGSTHFSGLGSSALKSGFPSNHVGFAFALVTPFAQQYDMPWLYGLAASTAFGRIQSRQHWLSDVVVGGVMGYAMGSLLLDQQRGRTGLQRIAIGPAGVQATWAFE